MKKLLLSVCTLALIGSVSANGNLKPLDKKSQKAVKFERNLSKDELVAPRTIIATTNNTPKSYAKSNAAPVLIGHTSYGLQSNSAIGRRVINYGNGKISAVWTTANAGENTSFASRGTGYNHFDGTNWLKTGATNYARIENVRTGFTNIVALPGDIETTAGHTPTSGFAFASSTSGSGSWTTVTRPEATLTLTGGSAPHPFWARMASSGNTIHFVACYSDTNQKYMGVTRPVVYSRSSDGGATWDTNGVILPEFSDYFDLGIADDYSIDAQGQNVAILYGTTGSSLILWKSTDGGLTFNKQIVHYVRKDLEASIDTAFANDGSSSVILDAAGKAHVAFTGCRVAGDGIADGSFSFFPGEIHLAYWNEDMGSDKAVELMINDSTLTGDPLTPYSVGAGTTQTSTDGGVRYGNNALANKPSVVVGADGFVYISVSLPGHDDIDVNNNSYRDIWVTRNCAVNNYTSFMSLTNISSSKGVEESFATLAKNTDGNLHFVFQQATAPGVPYSGADVAPSDLEIYYQSVPVGVVAGADCLPVSSVVSIKEAATKVGFSVAQNVPNPFNGTTVISVNSEKSAKASFEVRNMLGQVMISKIIDMNAGANAIEVSKSELTGSGIYFYTVRVGKNIVTNKMIVE